MRRTTITIFFIITVSFCALAQEANLQRADTLYADRDKVESLRQATALVEKDVTNYEAMWRLARFKYYLSDHEKEEDAKIKLLQAGIAAAEKAIKLDPNRVEGHFWLAANKGEYADMKGGFGALGLVKSVRKEFEAALTIDPSYDKGSIQLALGQMLIQMPALIGGSDKKGLEYLESGLKYGAQNAELKLALAEQYAKKNRKDDAKKLLNEILKEDDPLRTPHEQEELRGKARQMLATLK